jgi:hypothetical protein
VRDIFVPASLYFYLRHSKGEHSMHVLDCPSCSLSPLEASKPQRPGSATNALEGRPGGAATAHQPAINSNQQLAARWNVMPPAVLPAISTHFTTRRQTRVSSSKVRRSYSILDAHCLMISRSIVRFRTFCLSFRFFYPRRPANLDGAARDFFFYRARVLTLE